MWALLRAVALVLGLGVGTTTALSTTAATEDDPRVRAFLLAYPSLIDSVTYAGDDVVFFLRDQGIHFEDGRMLAGDALGRESECDPLFYRYPLEPLIEPPRLGEMPRYCTDLLEVLWGDTETEVRGHGHRVRFLGRRMFVNELIVDPLARVERDIRQTAVRAHDVAAWIDGMEITYSFDYREIAGSPTRSQHSFGLAVDFVPSSYEGRAVYWRWSEVLDREGWHRIPMDERWSPPQRVIEIFERHGFVWGGKWAYFDMIHFEYRPEILLYNRLVSAEE